jgi:NADH dehydrogenase/NADH:ubiquinone oxidoreductase 75 kD subunit (chain G)
MSKLSVTIDGVNVSAPQGSTILEAAELAGIRIPSLCFLKDRNVKANCRICVVEVKGSKTFQPACATLAAEKMEVLTDTPALREARKTSLELILSSHSWDCHHCLRIGNYKVEELNKELCSFCFFCDCVKEGDCELQALAEEYGVNKLPFDWAGDPLIVDDSTGALVRNPNKCIKCRRCIEVCNTEQTVNALGVERRGFKIQVAPVLGASLAQSPCVVCGKCIEVCPTGALSAKEHYDAMLYAARLEPGVTTVAQVSPKIRKELARLLNMDEHKLDLARLAAGLKKIGIDYVVSEKQANDHTLADAAKQLEAALKASKGVVILSNSAPAIAFLQQEFPDLAGSLLSYTSPEQRFGGIAKGEWAKQKGLAPETVRTVTLSENCAAKAEALQPENRNAAGPNVDFVLTPREIARMLNKTAVDINRLDPCKFDDLTADTGNCPAELRAVFADDAAKAGETVSEIQILSNGATVTAAVSHTLGGARQLLEQVRAGTFPGRVLRLRA